MDLLEDVKRMLLQHEGPDEVGLEIAAEGRVYMLDWPIVRVAASAELEARLREVLGDRGQATIEERTG
ncbi:MAG: hypothetical protein FJ317_08905 [SAR202 cluster bacterium]|nr:hypothetical protein [SAR202 cluster bacterium]